MSMFPARILDSRLDCLTCQKISYVLLIRRRPHQNGPYVSLSHCWGSGQYFHLTTGAIDQMKTGISKSLLSKTFNDAIRAMLELGVKYLWIDTLCIIQDSKSD